jgi:release factor glutamine methyltransferase
MRLADLLRHAFERLTAAGIEPGDARVEARLLTQHALGLTREQLITRSEDTVDPAPLEPLLIRREAREPLAYILGEREFYGLPFLVTPAVLIPRPETELLVEAALKHIKNGPWHRLPQVADIGTGSGCIATCITLNCLEANVYATDISEATLEVARRNAARHGAEITFLRGDLLAPLPDKHLFNAIVSNPPYIARDEADTLAPEVVDGEPHLALFDLDADGLGFYRRLASDAPKRLAPGGLLAVEVGMGQSGAVARLFEGAGLLDVQTIPDLAGIGRVVRGTKPS